jgi:IS30 family transposase
MELNLHANATTTPRTRAYIQRSKRKSVAELAAELGVSETTIYRWRSRSSVVDRSHTPKTLATSLSPMEETLVCELRTNLQLPLDDVTEVMRRCVNGKLSRSAIHRCLVRHGLNRRPKPDKPAIGTFEQATVGFIHIDLKHLPALEKRKSYAFVAIDRATRYVYLEVHLKRDAETAAGFLRRFLAHFPYPVHTILTDNGSEFTDRFAVDMKDKPRDRPSGRHPFDRVCGEHTIDHRLTKPYHPQTNGLAERFNRRIVDAIGRERKRGIAHRLFISHADRDAFLDRFVHDYNRTRLKCLGYLAPIQALNNPPGPNTKAGVQLFGQGLGSAKIWIPAFAGMSGECRCHRSLSLAASASFIRSGETAISMPARSCCSSITTRESRPSQPRAIASVISASARLHMRMGMPSSRPKALASDTSLCANFSAKAAGS